jgi:hypothetical protein
MITL